MRFYSSRRKDFPFARNVWRMGIHRRWIIRAPLLLNNAIASLFIQAFPSLPLPLSLFSFPAQFISFFRASENARPPRVGLNSGQYPRLIVFMNIEPFSMICRFMKETEFHLIGEFIYLLFTSLTLRLLVLTWIIHLFYELVTRIIVRIAHLNNWICWKSMLILKINSQLLQTNGIFYLNIKQRVQSFLYIEIFDSRNVLDMLGHRII